MTGLGECRYKEILELSAKLRESFAETKKSERFAALRAGVAS